MLTLPPLFTPPHRRRSLAGALATLLIAGLAVRADGQGRDDARSRLSPGDAEKYAVLDAHTYTLPVREPAAMSATDRDRLQQREADVSRAAAFYGFDISDTHWSYRQILCGELPDHLLLSFDSDSADHGASHFVAVVPPGDGKVQVVTAYARGLLPFHAAWEKSTAYATFNRMTEADRGEQRVGAASHWLTLGMCFAALTGHVPQVPEPMNNVDASEALVKRNGSTPVIHIDKPGNAEVTFSDVSQQNEVGNWKLRFDARGRLTRAELDAVKPLHTRLAPMSPIVAPVRPE